MTPIAAGTGPSNRRPMAERAFGAELLARLRDRREVRVETRGTDGAIHRTIVWVVVDRSGRVLLRSYRGPTARWYREATAAGQAGLLLDGSTIPVKIEAATDSVRIDACSRELAAKYAGDPATASMLRDEVLDTTLELLPA